MKKYTIKAGKFYASGLNFDIHFGDDSLHQLVKFSPSCLYKPFDKENDTNKGFGFNYSFFNDNNSLRWGWRQHPTDETLLQVCIYVHDQGEKKLSSYIDVSPNVTYELELYMAGGEAWLEVSNGIVVDTVSLKGLTFIPKWGYKNFPYFGGDNPARHKTYIYAKEV